MTIDGAYQLVQFIYNKNQSGNITPAQFNLLAPIAQLSKVNELLGLEQQYAPHDPTPKIGFSVNQKNREDLRPLLVPPTSITPSSGIAAYPVDYLYYDVMTTNGGLIITEATPDEIAIMNQSLIAPPSDIYPKFVLHATGIFIYPNTLTPIKLSYVKKPVDPVWGYTVVNNEPVYNSGTSVDFTLPPLTHLDIVNRILSKIGVNLSMGEVTQYAEAMLAKGE